MSDISLEGKYSWAEFSLPDGNGKGRDNPKSAFALGEVCDILKNIVPCASVWEK